MKKVFIFVLSLSVMVACKEADTRSGKIETLSKEEIEKAKNDSTQLTSLEWLDSTTQQLGQLKKDKEIEISWRFRNSGDKMLVIENVTASCGCTIPEKPEKPLAPGEEGLIKAKFNGSGSGTIHKYVHVFANTKPAREFTLTFTGDITEKK